MPIRIKAPDGSIAEFPDGTDDATIESVMAKTFGGPKPKLTGGQVVKDVGKAGGSGVIVGTTGAVDALGAGPFNAPALLRLGSSIAGAFGAKNTAIGLSTVSDAMSDPLTKAAEKHVPVAAYKPQTTAGKFAKAVGTMAPNAAMPGGLIRRGAAVVLPGLISEAAGEAAEAIGAPKWVQTGARVAGAVTGGVAAGARPGLIPQAPGGVKPGLINRAVPDVVKARQAQRGLIDSGVDPSVIDVAGDKGLRTARAVGTKSQDAGEVLQGNARRAVADTKPAVMSDTRQLLSDPRTADQFISDLLDKRATNATRDYKDAYETPVPLSEEVLSALGEAPGRSALQRARRAAVARQETSRTEEIDRLIAANELGAKVAPQSVSAAALDRTQIALGAQSKRLKKNEGADIASGLDMRRGVINDALDQVPELAPARKAYRETTQAIDVIGREGKKATRKDIFSTDPTDYAAWVGKLSPEARDANAIAIRQEVLDTLGGQRKSSMGSVEQLVDSEYARDNLRVALGDSVADKFLGTVDARLKQLRSAQFVSPNAGSRTAVLDNDVAALEGIVSVGKAAAMAKGGHILPLFEMAANKLRSVGVSENDAKALANLVTDPSKTEAVLAYLEKNYGPVAARRYAALGRVGAAGGVALLTSGAAPEPEQ